MTTDYVDLPPGSTIRQVISAFSMKRLDICCITEDNKLVGIVHKYTVYKALLDNYALEDSISQLINREVITIYKEQHLLEARDIMIQGNVSQAVVLDNNNQVHGIMTKTDLITSNMAALQDMLNRMTSLIENLQDAVIFINKDLKITTLNKTFVTLFDLEKELLIGSKIETLVPSFKRWIVETFRTEKIHDAKRIDLQDFTVIASFIPIKELGNVSGVMIVLRDITSFENIADELETTNNIRKILDSALDLSYDGVVITDNNGDITMTNKGFNELFNFTNSKKILGRSIAEIAPQINSDQSLKYDRKIKGELIEIDQKKCIVAQMPIYQNGQKIGAILKIIFRQLETWKDILFHMDKLENQVNFYRDELMRISQVSNSFKHIITVNEQMDKLKKEASVAAKSPTNILITGESGTGKELIAKGIHEASGRKGEFVTINCGAIPAELLESEFFGYEEGAFTGAKRGGKKGKFEIANNGTLFLDEIADMPFALQVKLLRVIQEQEFERLGAIESTKVDVHILTATNKNIAALVEQEKFREDLYYRINVIHLKIPSLKERLDDIPLLCKHFIDKFNYKFGKNIIGVTPEVIQAFQKYHWPGNIRELENTLERAYHFTDSSWIKMDLISKKFTHSDRSTTNRMEKQNTNQADNIDRKNVIDNTDKEIILKALIQSEGNRTKAASILGISRTTLYNKINKYSITGEINFRG